MLKGRKLASAGCCAIDEGGEHSGRARVRPSTWVKHHTVHYQSEGEGTLISCHTEAVECDPREYRRGRVGWVGEYEGGKGLQGAHLDVLPDGDTGGGRGRGSNRDNGDISRTLMSCHTKAVEWDTREEATSSSIFGGREERSGSAWDPAVMEARTSV
jgi:hypothetical protein